MTVVVLLAYAIGVILGLIALRVERCRMVWSHIIRTQLLLVAILISVTAVWQIESLPDIIWPLLIVVATGVLLGVSLLTTKGEGRVGRATLYAMSAAPNTSFFVLPVAAATVGPVGVIVAVLLDRLAAPLWALYTWILRKHAPRKQRRRTSWIDQSPNIGVAIGVVLYFTIPAPDWISVIDLWAGPILAATGAAIFVGSAFHPSQRVNPRKGFKRWAVMVALRIGLLAPLFIFAPSKPIAIVTILAALSIPAFGPSQFSTMYGYSEPEVAAANKYGWYVGAVGVIAALLLVHYQ